MIDLALHPVSPRVNRPTVDDATCIQPVREDSSGESGLFEQRD